MLCLKDGSSQFPCKFCFTKWNRAVLCCLHSSKWKYSPGSCSEVECFLQKQKLSAQWFLSSEADKWKYDWPSNKYAPNLDTKRLTKGIAESQRSAHEIWRQAGCFFFMACTKGPHKWTSTYSPFFHARRSCIIQFMQYTRQLLYVLHRGYSVVFSLKEEKRRNAVLNISALYWSLLFIGLVKKYLIFRFMVTVLFKEFENLKNWHWNKE